MKEKLRLIPLQVNWKAGRYGIHIEGQEAATLRVSTMVTLSDDSKKRLTIQFESFAACRFLNFNFGDQHYNEYLIRSPDNMFLEDTADWEPYCHLFREKGICPNPYFYIVENTSWFREKQVYQRLPKRGFKHFLLVGYDSYLEVLAKDDLKYQLDSQ
jgi:hypothetical protein